MHQSIHDSVLYPHPHMHSMVCIMNESQRIDWQSEEAVKQMNIIEKVMLGYLPYVVCLVIRIVCLLFVTAFIIFLCMCLSHVLVRI